MFLYERILEITHGVFVLKEFLQENIDFYYSIILLYFILFVVWFDVIWSFKYP